MVDDEVSRPSGEGRPLGSQASGAIAQEQSVRVVGQGVDGCREGPQGRAPARRLDDAEIRAPFPRFVATLEASTVFIRSWLLSEGFTDDQIKDTSATKPWDFEAERDGKKCYVEAKGSASAWSDESTVIVTRNEVVHA
jgi:hypothetical protein